MRKQFQVVSFKFLVREEKYGKWPEQHQLQGVETVFSGQFSVVGKRREKPEEINRARSLRKTIRSAKNCLLASEAEGCCNANEANLRKWGNTDPHSNTRAGWREEFLRSLRSRGKYFS
jgi:hypothetical protein